MKGLEGGVAGGSIKGAAGPWGFMAIGGSLERSSRNELQHRGWKQYCRQEGFAVQAAWF